MPIHLEDLDVTPEIAGLKSALIVPCNMCAAASVAVREGKPFLQLFWDLLKSAPLKQHIKALQSRLSEEGVDSEVFRSDLPHQWFLCLCPSGRRKQLESRASRHDAAIVLGCDSATETVRESVEPTGCKVVPGMEVTGIMNTRPKLRFPGTLSFEDCKIVPLSEQKEQEDLSG